MARQLFSYPFSFLQSQSTSGHSSLNVKSSVTSPIIQTKRPDGNQLTDVTAPHLSGKNKTTDERLDGNQLTDVTATHLSGKNGISDDNQL